MRRQIEVNENPRGKTIRAVDYRRTPPRCGELVSTQATIRSDRRYFRRMGLWNFSELRTRGGAVYRRNTAFGIHKGRDGSNPSRRAVFTPMPNISRFFGTVVVTPDSLAVVNG